MANRISVEGKYAVSFSSPDKMLGVTIGVDQCPGNLDVYFESLSIILNATTELGSQINILNAEMTIWERRKARVEVWTQRGDPSAPHPLSTPYKVLHISVVLYGLDHLLDKCREVAKQNSLTTTKEHA
jgi:hypothetical protein